MRLTLFHFHLYFLFLPSPRPFLFPIPLPPSPSLPPALTIADPMVITPALSFLIGSPDREPRRRLRHYEIGVPCAVAPPAPPPNTIFRRAILATPTPGYSFAPLPETPTAHAHDPSHTHTILQTPTTVDSFWDPEPNLDREAE